MNKIISFLKNEVVLIISFILAIASSFFVKPNREYIGYIDFKTLGVLFSLMVVTCVLNSLGLFSFLAQKLLNKVNSTRKLNVLFCMLCFFSSMLITNDVALITFVPFTILTLKKSNNNGLIIPLITLETISANLGSMLTPIGNPQNLYLFSRFNMSIKEFLITISPYAALSFVIIVVFSILLKNNKIDNNKAEIVFEKNKIKYCIICFALFVLALLSVFRILNVIILVIITLVALIIIDKKSILKVDYSLLLTFVCLFIFIGNLGKIESISNFLSQIIVNNEVLVGVLASQVFSNVPTAILLSGFSSNASELLIGVNLGGLGTLIASMASLISFKLLSKEKIKMGKYLLIFTVYNIIFLIANIALWIII